MPNKTLPCINSPNKAFNLTSMNVAGSALVLTLFIGILLYFRLMKRQENSSEDYKRLFDGIPTPMYIYVVLSWPEIINGGIKRLKEIN